MIYVIGERRVGVVKIGRTRDPEARLLTLQTGNPRRLRILATFSGDRQLESDLHDAFRTKRVVGEWFDFGTADGVDLVAKHVAAMTGAFPETYSAPPSVRERRLQRDLSVLRCLTEHVGVNRKVKATLSGLAARLGSDSRTAAESIDRLCAAGLIEVTRPGSGGGYPTTYRVLETQGTLEFQEAARPPIGRHPTDWMVASVDDQHRTGEVAR